MTNDEYIAAVLRTESTPTNEMAGRMTGEIRALHALMGLQTEVGELTDSFKRYIFYDETQNMGNVAEEIGDVLWYLALLLDDSGLSFDYCMKRNIAKLKKRYPEKFTSDKALNRDLESEREALEGTAVGSLNINPQDSAPSPQDVLDALDTGWSLRYAIYGTDSNFYTLHGRRTFYIFLPHDASEHWAGIYHPVSVPGVGQVDAPHWLRRRLDELKSRKGEQDADTVTTEE